MAECWEHHKELNEHGVGKCSVPMWMNGCPAGFCDEPAFGEPVKVCGRCKYDGYVPFLACPNHGGPTAKEE
jgi:hypothetical protein